MFLLGAGIAFLLYFIWLGMSAIGLRGITNAQQIRTIRQQAGAFLFLLFLTLISLILLAQFLFPVHPG
jgi:hypothetical protein